MPFHSSILIPESYKFLKVRSDYLKMMFISFLLSIEVFKNSITDKQDTFAAEFSIFLLLQGTRKIEFCPFILQAR